MPHSGGAFLAYEIVRPISREGYAVFLEITNAIINKYGELRLLLYYKNFEGWEREAAEMDLEAHITIGHNMKRFAIVSAPEREIMSRMIKKPMLGGEIRFFSENRLDDALAWVKEGMPEIRE